MIIIIIIVIIIMYLVCGNVAAARGRRPRLLARGQREASASNHTAAARSPPINNRASWLASSSLFLICRPADNSFPLERRHRARQWTSRANGKHHNTLLASCDH